MPGPRAGPPASRSSPRRPRSSRRGCRGCRRTRPSTSSPARPGSAEPLAAVDPQDRRGRTSASVSSGSSRIRCIITGTTTSAVALVLGDRLQRLLGVELAPQDVGRAQRQPEQEVREAPGVEQRRRDHRRLAGPQRDPREHRGQRARALSGGARWAPFGVPVVPEVRMMNRPDSSGGSRSSRRRPPISSSRRRVAAARSSSLPGDEALQVLLARSGEQLGELLVVDQRLRAPRARPRSTSCGAGERRVQVEGVGAELRAGERRVDEAAVVARHDRDPVALLDPLARRAPARARSSAGATSAKVSVAGLVDRSPSRRVADRRRRRCRRRATAPQRCSSRSDPRQLVRAGRRGSPPPRTASSR